MLEQQYCEITGLPIDPSRAKEWWVVDDRYLISCHSSEAAARAAITWRHQRRCPGKQFFIEEM